jgi:stage II sporulation protein D
VDVRLPPGEVAEVTVKSLAPGKVQYAVVLAEAPAWDFDTLRTLRQQWKDRGLAVATRNTGTTYSLAGRMFDTRQTLLVLDGDLPSKEEADKRLLALEKQYAVDLRLHAQMAETPSAELVVKLPGGVQVVARDVLWFEALRQSGESASLTLVGSRGGARAELALPGRIYTVAGTDGLEVVNEAEVERLLEGIVASEIFSSAPDAALRAQAVAARTDLLAKVGTRHATDPFAICSEVHCQAYRGLERVSPRVAAAVRDTKGQVLVDAEGRLVDAYYHAASGGHTENNELVWTGRPQPALRGRTDTTSGESPYGKLADGAGPTDGQVASWLERKDTSWAAASGMNAEACRWRIERSAQELQSQLVRFGGSGPVKSLRVARRGVSGRAIVLEVEQVDGKQFKVEGELRIRDALGGSHGAKGLRSALVLLQPGPAGPSGAPRHWTMTGAGFGHGVGMDQTGAVARAKAGQSHQQILLHYYAGAQVANLY